MVFLVHVRWKTFDRHALLVELLLLIHFPHFSFEIAREPLSLLRCRVDHLVTNGWPERIRLHACNQKWFSENAWLFSGDF